MNTSNVPARTAPCDACGTTIDLNNHAHGQRATGWSKRLGKTSTLIESPRYEPIYACTTCINAMKHSGSQWKQTPLFEMDDQ